MTGLVYLFYPVFIYLIIHIFREGYWQKSFRDLVAVIKKNNKAVLLILLANLILILFLDRPVSLFFKNYQLDSLDALAIFGNSLGGFSTLFPFIILVIILAKLFNLDKLKNLFLISFSSTIYARIAVFILKLLISRARPFYNYNPYQFFKYRQAITQITDILKKANLGQIAEFTYASMPSGHTVTAFAFIVPFYLYFQNKFIRALLVFLGSSTAFARVYINVHWPADVFLAAIIGSLIAAVIYHNNKSRI